MGRARRMGLCSSVYLPVLFVSYCTGKGFILCAPKGLRLWVSLLTTKMTELNYLETPVRK